MVGFDLPHVTNDMIMRFMDVDPKDVLGSAALPSRLGSEERVRFDSSIDGVVGHGEAGSTVVLKDGKSHMSYTRGDRLTDAYVLQLGIMPLQP